ncbi:MAG: hypothetical protein AAF493_07950 [Pseudomonadota bacterium]
MSLLESWGLSPGLFIGAGTPDAPAARRVMESHPSVLVLPYHRHRDWDGNWVNGFGVAYRLGDEFLESAIPILMSVDDIAFHSEFPRELDRFYRHCPTLFARLVVHRVTSARGQRLRTALRLAAETDPSRSHAIS